MKLKEFLLGMSIITLCVIASSIINPPEIKTTKEIKINKIETVRIETDEEGNVEVYYEN